MRKAALMTVARPHHPNRARRLLWLIPAAAVVLASCSSAPAKARHPHAKPKATTTTLPATTTTAPNTSTTAPGVAAPPCTISALSAKEVASGAGANGDATTVVALTNVSKAACSLSGYPQLQLLDTTGANIPTTVQKSGPGIPSSLTVQSVNLVARGGQASFLLYWVALPSKTEPTCTIAPKVKVSVPGSSKTLTMTAEIEACGGIVAASPFQPGIVAT
jgi:Protein of unknown function (DUF4232)